MKILCINLPERKNRLEHFKKEFEKINIENELIIIEAIKHPIGCLGCKMTYLTIFNQFKDEEMILIFEDDVLFINNFNDVFIKAYSQLPKNWDMLYLGGNPQQDQSRYSNNLFWAKNILTTHAIIYNNQHGLFKYILNRQQYFNKIDLFFAKNVQEHFNCFLVYPLLATQYINLSDICKNSDYSMIEKNYNKYCND